MHALYFSSNHNNNGNVEMQKRNISKRYHQSFYIFIGDVIYSYFSKY